MVKKPSSKPADSEAGIAASLSAEQAAFQSQEDRIADLERRIVEMNEQLSVVSGAAPVDTPLDAQLVEQQNERLAELQHVIGNLNERLAAAQQINAREEQFNAALRSVEAAAAAVQRGVATPVAAAPGAVPGVEQGCDCEECECIDCSTCCVFEIWMSAAWVNAMQNPLIDIIGDSNVLPTAMLEMWFFAALGPNQWGVCIPNAAANSYLPMHKQITQSVGPPVQINRLVGRVTVKKGLPKTITITLTAVEREDAAERLQPVNRDEWGINSKDVTLDCCYSSYSSIEILVPLDNWGQAGGAVTGEFKIVKAC